MKARTGKIAQLPKPIRDDLNHRLENGQPGRELLAWLNELPETKELLAKSNQQPINKSNLSDWRHGGYSEWLQDQAREARIQRISESGESLEQAETGDLFENFARIAVAELMADLDGLQKLRGEKRSQYLHKLVSDLARLQFGYNHSRRTALAWNKYNDNLPKRPSIPPVSQPDTNSSSTTAVVPGRAGSCDEKPHDVKPPYDPFKYIHHTRCCHKPCLKCHAPESEYPMDEVLRDKAFYQQHGEHPCDRHGRHRHLINVDCDCPCDRCAEKTAPPALTATELSPPRSTRITEHGTRPPISPISPIRPVPSAQLADFSRRLSLLKTASR